MEHANTGAAFFIREITMQFTKAPLSTHDLLQLMLNRGLLCADKVRACRHLSHVSYYRLNGYARHFYVDESAASPNFLPGTKFETIWRIYCFDRELRLLTLDAVERIEVAVRTVLSDTLSVADPSAPGLPYGSHWFMENAFFKSPKDCAAFCTIVEEETGKNNCRRRSAPTDHYYKTYTSPALPPSWIVMESLSMGSWVTALQNLTHPVQNFLAGKFGLPRVLFTSWLASLRVVRNISAQHGRFWKRTLDRPFKVPRPGFANLCPDFRSKEDSYYAAACVSWFFLLQLAPSSHWPEKLKNLFEKYTEVSCTELGFPQNWYNDPFWKI